MNTYEVVKSYNNLKNDIKKYIEDKYDFENNDAEFYSFDIVLNEQDQVIVKFTIKYCEPTMFKSDSITFDEFMRETNYVGY